MRLSKSPATDEEDYETEEDGVPRSMSIEALAELLGAEEEAEEEEEEDRVALFASKLALFVDRSLQQAAAIPSAEAESVLVQLWSNLSSRVEAPVTRYFGSRYCAHAYYYEVVAEHMAREERPLAVDLYGVLAGSLTFSRLFAAVLGTWVFSRGEAKHVKLLLAGANRVFWDNVEKRRATHRPLYERVRDVLCDKRWWRPTTRRYLRDVYCLVCRFSFFYERNAECASAIRNRVRLQVLLSEYRDEESRVLFLDENLEPADLFMQKADDGNPLLASDLDELHLAQVLRVLALLSKEAVLIRYLRACVVFRDYRLSSLSKITLHSELYARTKEGNPHYLPAKVRHAASEVLDILYPGQVLSRRLVYTVFRLYTQPIYFLRSMWRRVYSLFVRAFFW